MQNYYVCQDEIPEPFRAADLLMAQLHPEPEYVDLKAVTREVPGPTITINHGAIGPLRITKEWYDEQVALRDQRNRDAIKQAEIEMIQYIARIEMLRGKLGELNPHKSKDSKKIAAINIEIKEIESLMGCLEMQYGISASEIDHGTRVGRFLGRIKMKFRKFKKKVKRFFKANAGLIVGIAPIILGVVANWIGSLFSKKG